MRVEEVVGLRQLVYDTKVVVNGLEIPEVCISSVSVRRVKAPDIGSCTISLINHRKVFWPDTDVVRYSDLSDTMVERSLYEFNQNFVARQQNKGLWLHKGVCFFRENDIVCVFVKINEQWSWLFFGYITGWEESVAPSGLDTITLTCEDSLKMLRLSRLEFHNLLVPQDVQVSDVEQWLKTDYTPYRDTMQGKSFYDQVKVVFGIGGIGASSIGESFWEEGQSWNIASYSGNPLTVSVGDCTGIQEYFCQVDGLYEIGNDADLKNLLNEISGWGSSRDDLFPKRKVHMLRIAESAPVWHKLTTSFLMSPFSLSNIQGVSRLDLLRDALKYMFYEVIVLPNGDVLIEPLWLGILFGKRDELLKIGYLLDLDLCAGASISMNGNDIVTAVFQSYGFANPAVQPQENVPNQLYKYARVLEDAKLFGLRIAHDDLFLGRLTSEEEVKLVTELALLKYWYRVRTASYKISPDRKIWLLNRPVYDEVTRGFYMIEGVSVSVDERKFLTCSLSLRGGMLLSYEKGVGQYVFGVTEVGDNLVRDFSISNILDFYFQLEGTVTPAQVPQTPLKEKPLPQGSNMPFLVGSTCVTSGFGEPRPGGHAHRGIDYRAKENSPVIMPWKGTVVDVEDNRWNPGRVSSVTLDSGAYRIKLVHVIPSVARGEVISPGAIVGTIGPKDLVSTGPHLHLEVYKGGNLVNPEELVGKVRRC